MSRRFKGYKTIGFAVGAFLMSGAGAMAQDWNSSGPVIVHNVASQDMVAVDGAGHPVNADMINADGSFKAGNPACVPACSWVAFSSLTPAQQAEVTADAAAARFFGATSQITRTNTDTTSGASYTTTRTGAGVRTSNTYDNGHGGASTFSANGVTVVSTTGQTVVSGGNVAASGVVSGGTVVAGGRDVGASLATHDQQIATTTNRLDGFNGSGGSLENWANGVNATTAAHDQQIASLEGWRGVASTQIATLQNDVKELRGGIALSMAMTAPHVSDSKRFALTVSGADYAGHGAFAAGAALRVSNNAQLFISGGTAFEGGPAAVKGGATFEW